MSLSHLVSIVGLITIGCGSVPLTPDEQHERDDALIVETEQFWVKYDNCLRTGTVLFPNSRKLIRRSISKRNRPQIDVWTMRSAVCVPRL